jgi:hypothetical protein
VGHGTPKKLAVAGEEGKVGQNRSLCGGKHPPLTLLLAPSTRTGRRCSSPPALETRTKTCHIYSNSNHGPHLPREILHHECGQEPHGIGSAQPIFCTLVDMFECFSTPFVGSLSLFFTPFPAPPF